MSYDQKCFDLAEYFLPDNAGEEVKNQLAQVIQTAIEDELAWIGECEKCGNVPAAECTVTEETPTDRGRESRRVPMKLCVDCMEKAEKR